jgi:hypothetical protein
VATLPRCQVALLTSTSIINHTLENLLNAAHSCRDVTLLGASTPLVTMERPAPFVCGSGPRGSPLRSLTHDAAKRSRSFRCD